MEWLEGHWLEVLLGIVMGLMTFFGKRELDRVDRKADTKDVSAILATLDAHVEEDRETRVEILGELKSMRQEAKQDRHEIYDKIESAAEMQAEQNLKVAAQVGELHGMFKGGQR